MVLRNHGIVICGETIEEAFYLAHNAVKACINQVKYSFGLLFIKVIYNVNSSPKFTLVMAYGGLVQMKS